jgi:hypothetical protein
MVWLLQSQQFVTFPRFDPAIVASLCSLARAIPPARFAGCSLSVEIANRVPLPLLDVDPVTPRRALRG